jgi:predicted NBD/HSP70 family sugar kinase
MLINPTEIAPRFIPPLDDAFFPAALVNQAYLSRVDQHGVPLVIGLERENHEMSRYETRVFAPEDPASHENFLYADRIVKFLLWQRGGYKLFVGGPAGIGDYIRQAYSPEGRHNFDQHMMSKQVYLQPFEVISCRAEDVPPANEAGKRIGHQLNGCRIGFDLGASDRKVSAVIDGKVVFSEEVVWEPSKQVDPEYHFRELTASLKAASSKMPRVDAIGGSSAGIIIENRPMISSLFRGIPDDRLYMARDLFLRIQREFNVPLTVLNDGDVTALAGAMSLEDTGILGIALGSSVASGYVDRNGCILGWLNELAFTPIDYNPNANPDDWSGDTGCGSKYLSQQCVFRLAPKAGIHIPENLNNAEKLVSVQKLLEAGNPGAVAIWKTLGIYLGYSLAHYASFYDIKHALILGRCTSGSGGNLILEGAKAVLNAEFPQLSSQIQIHLPDEKIRRIGQAIAAASLPQITQQERI